MAQCHRSTTVHSYGASGELERHYAFIHPPLPRADLAIRPTTTSSQADLQPCEDDISPKCRLCNQGAEVSTDYWQSSNPDFNSLSSEEKDQIYQDLHNQIDSLNLQSISFAHIALSCGDTGPALESGLANQEFVIAFVCRFQVILSHGYINFPTIDDLQQRLLDQYLRIGLEGDSRVPGPPDHPFRTVREGSSWEGSGHIQLPLIPQDSTIANNYRQYQDSEGIEMTP
jgi:hypothetical protein